MTFMLPSVTASPPSGKPAERSAAQNNTQQAEAPDSFGQALSRALKPEAQASDKPGAKTATPAATKRQAAEDPTAPPALPDAAALALLPPAQVPVLPAALARAGLAGAANANANASANANAASVISPASTPGPELAPADATPADPATLAAALRATSQAGLNPPPTRFNAAGADTALAPGHAPTLGPAPAADAGASGTSSQADDRARQTPMMAPGAARAGAAAAAAAAANPADEAAALPVIPGQTPAADSANPNAALTLGAVAAMPAGGAGAAAAPAPAAASASPLLAPEVGSSEWGKALGQQVVHLGQAGQQQAELQLNPPGLGPLKVTLSLNDQQLQAMFVSAHASVRAAVEAALPQLRASLADNGISLGNTSVSADNQQQAAFAQEQHRQPNQRAYANTPPPSIPANPAPRPLGEPLRQGHGLSVDTYA
ncbi:flagellar hook-length control protein FliK [Rhodoferax sp.]|uniref:flagellar hook-length control protein FliK n=2 Tax=Rhodoferax sp. TaxID=50421 RepID=UPI0027324E60|nr:flagellar hook-length control protein FliK [Rhodoferax sp.]MDP3192383.1 flagellar hook-length control protein FliK [Rhodoferax sp.]